MRSALGAAERMEGGDRAGRLEKWLRAVAREPCVRFQLAGPASTDADHHARVVSRPAKQNGEDGGTTQAAVLPEPPPAVQQTIDVECEESRRDVFPAPRHALDPCERAIGGKELEGARHRGASRHDLELGAQPHVSEWRRRSPRVAAAHHFVYAGVVASAETMKVTYMPLGACPGTPQASKYLAAGDALNVV